MEYKFERLEVWKLSLDLTDGVYEVSGDLPESEKFNLVSQICRASTSISLNIAEGSTSQSNAEQGRFLSYALRSLIEVVACLRLIERRNYNIDMNMMGNLEEVCQKLFIKLQAFINSMKRELK